jgi:hypothetical protein
VFCSFSFHMVGAAEDVGGRPGLAPPGRKKEKYSALRQSPMFAVAAQAGLRGDSAGDCHLVAAHRVVRPTRPLTARRATVGDSRDSTLVAFQTPSKCAAEPDLGAFFAPNLHIQTSQKWGGLSAGVG